MLTTHLTLLERLRTRTDEAAWKRFVDLYSPLLETWAKRIGLQSDDAADVVQEVLTLLLEKLPHFQYDPGKSFRAWLKTVFFNKSRERHRRAVLPMVADAAAVDFVVAPDSEEEERDDRRLMVRRGLELVRGEFPAQQWQAFWEYAICERPAGEVAAELGLSVGSVYAAKSRVLSRLRSDLGIFVD